MIRVTDNGCGIGADQLHLAIASHATSKITSADDLFAVDSLGFRGEALASIASISRMNIRSRVADAESGAELEVVGGRAEPISPVGCPPGTTIEIRQLFFNTPVRHKFMRTTQTEMGHIGEAITRLALGHPQVHFTLTHGGRTIHDLPAVGDTRQRVSELFGEDLAESLIEIESSDEAVRLHGYVANPNQSRGNNRLQYLFLNGRCIRDRSLQHALGEAYRGLLLTGRYPICFLSLEMPPQVVDVNVHPTKQEVRFQDGGRLYSQLLGTLRSRFLTTDLVARGSVPEVATPEADEIAQSTPAKSDLFDWAKRQLTPAGSPEASGFEAHGRGAPDGGLQLHSFEQPERASDATLDANEAASYRVDPPESAKALQIHNRYLVLENEDGLEVIDQHALHERILYESLREKVANGALESQRLLVPEPVDLSANETAAVLQQQELLASLGLEVQEFGGETVLLSAYPAMLANFSPGDVLRGIAEQLLTEGKTPQRRDLLDELMHSIACKAAVKFGDALTPEEVDSLLAQRHLAQDHHHCPHGRPTALVFTREQLDKQFKRI